MKYILAFIVFIFVSILYIKIGLDPFRIWANFVACLALGLITITAPRIGYEHESKEVIDLFGIGFVFFSLLEIWAYEAGYIAAGERNPTYIGQFIWWYLCTSVDLKADVFALIGLSALFILSPIFSFISRQIIEVRFLHFIDDFKIFIEFKDLIPTEKPENSQTNSITRIRSFSFKVFFGPLLGYWQKITAPFSIVALFGMKICIGVAAAFSSASVMNFFFSWAPASQTPSGLLPYTLNLLLHLSSVWIFTVLMLIVATGFLVAKNRGLHSSHKKN
ncbi:hypothetical protein [Gluconobacter sphaericus]|uniref:hypothetical protein n=1 Tax=Gluconobacter sphaericus TaxID=574987 RepID=UPI00312B5CA3